MSQNTQYYKENVVNILTKRVESYMKNPEKQNALSKSFYTSYPKKRKALSKSSYRSNPEKQKTLSKLSYRAKTESSKLPLKWTLLQIVMLGLSLLRLTTQITLKHLWRNKHDLAEPKLYVKEQYLKEIQFNLLDDPIAWLELLKAYKKEHVDLAKRMSKGMSKAVCKIAAKQILNKTLQMQSYYIN